MADADLEAADREAKAKIRRADGLKAEEAASGLAADVRRYLKNESVEACPPSAWYRLSKFARRNRMAILVGTILFASMFIGAISTALTRPS